jgi:PEGA domain
MLVLSLALLLNATPKLAIVDLDAADDMNGLAAQVARTLVAEAQKLGYSVVPPEELRLTLQPARYTELKKCGGQPGCVAAYMLNSPFKKIVLGKLNRDEKNYLLKLWLIDVQDLSVITSVDRAILIAARRFPKDIQQAVPPFLKGEREALGQLAITSNVKRAEIFINGESMGNPPVEVSLKPGKYEVKIERPHYLSVTRLFEVVANQRNVQPVTLMLIPGQPADADTTDGPAVATSDSNATPIQLSAPTWVFLGLTGVAAGVAGVFGGVAKTKEGQLLDGYDRMTGVYQGNRAQAIDAQQNALSSNIAWGVAGAAAVATVVFLVVDLTRKEPTKVALSPVLSPTFSGVALEGSF